MSDGWRPARNAVSSSRAYQRRQARSAGIDPMALDATSPLTVEWLNEASEAEGAGMTHPLAMSLSVTGWNVEGDLLESVAIELTHSEALGDELLLKLTFKSGRLAKVFGALTAAGARQAYQSIQHEISVPAGVVIDQ